MDPSLRTKLDRPPLPSSASAGAWVDFAVQDEALVTVSEMRTAFAVKSLDNCNAANLKLTQALAPKPSAWGRLWRTMTFRN